MLHFITATFLPFPYVTYLCCGIVRREKNITTQGALGITTYPRVILLHGYIMSAFFVPLPFGAAGTWKITCRGQNMEPKIVRAWRLSADIYSVQGRRFAEHFISI